MSLSHCRLLARRTSCADDVGHDVAAMGAQRRNFLRGQHCRLRFFPSKYSFSLFLLTYARHPRSGAFWKIGARADERHLDQGSDD